MYWLPLFVIYTFSHTFADTKRYLNIVGATFKSKHPFFWSNSGDIERSLLIPYHVPCLVINLLDIEYKESLRNVMWLLRYSISMLRIYLFSFLLLLFLLTYSRIHRLAMMWALFPISFHVFFTSTIGFHDFQYLCLHRAWHISSGKIIKPNKYTIH